MRWFVLGSALAALAVCSACGGQVERNPGGGMGGSSSAAGSAGADTGFPSEPLGDCEPGFSHSQNPTLPCPWIGEGLCYAEKARACACVCPTDHDSWCTSDFPDPSGAPTQVFCE